MAFKIKCKDILLGFRNYQHAKIIDSGPGRSKLLRFFFGPVDIYITFLFGAADLANKRGIRYFSLLASRILTGRFKRAQLIFPLIGHEEQYWNDAISLFKKKEPDDLPGHEWSKDRCFLLVTNVPPYKFKNESFPLVSIDITDIKSSEVQLLVVSLGRLCSRNRCFPFGMSEGYGRALFEQNLSLLPEAYPERTLNSALDVLALPYHVIPSLTVDFKYFNPVIRERFDSVCEETLYSREGALSWDAILEMRQKLQQKEEILFNERTLPGEKLIRELWC